MKHLKVRATLNSAKTEVTVTILEQTHRCNEFGNYPDATNTFICVNDITLMSVAMPEWDEEEDTLYVRGHGTHRDNESVTMSLEDWARVKEAIVAYNEWGGHSHE